MTLPGLDIRPLQEEHSVRGIGRYVTTLLTTLHFDRVVVWSGLPLPEGVGLLDVIRVPGAPSSGRLGWLADARQGRPIAGEVHVPVADVRLSRPRPSIVTAFDAIPWRFPEDYPAGSIGRVRRRGDAAFARRMNRVITCSEASAEDLVGYLGVPASALRIVPLTAGPPWPEPAAGSGRRAPERHRKGRRYVVAAGGFTHADPRKRLGDLLEALARLPEEVSLVVTGADGPESQTFHRQAISLGVQERVELTGQVAPDELVELYSGAAVFAFPSAWEGFGLPLVEAMSVGLPCVVADGGALAEVAGNAATVVPVGDTYDLSDALLDVLHDGRRAADASRRSTTRAAEYGISRFAEAHAKVYAEA